MLAHPGQAIFIRNIGYLANKAYENAFSLKNITHAFEKTGLWPINRLVFSDEDFIASSVTDRPLIPNEPLREPLRENTLESNLYSSEQPSTSSLRLENLIPYPKASTNKPRSSKIDNLHRHS